MAKTISSGSALILIVIAQFLGTSLWFAGNAAAGEWEVLLGKEGIVPILTSSVQLGFILGTFLYAFWSIPDRFSPSRVFLFSAILAALSNFALLLLPLSLYSLIFFRFLVGFFLAGIYPVGMKIAADYFEKGLGSALGFLVGALVLGTAFPFLLKALGWSLSWEITLGSTSLFAIIGGLMIGLGVPDGPFRKINPKLDLSLLPKLAQNTMLKGAAGGYFGHMWELYTFWTFLPALLVSLLPDFDSSSILLWTFLIIASGSASCVLGGWIALTKGSKVVALTSLWGSGLCGLVILFFPNLPSLAILPFLVLWGILVVSDSPQFSTLVAQSVAPEFRGTALTLVNCLGFGLTVVSIQTARILSSLVSVHVFLGLLCLGPALGIFLFKRFRN